MLLCVYIDFDVVNIMDILNVYYTSSKMDSILGTEGIPSKYSIPCLDVA